MGTLKGSLKFLQTPPRQRKQNSSNLLPVAYPRVNTSEATLKSKSCEIHLIIPNALGGGLLVI